MIYLTETQQGKVDLIDQFIDAATPESLKEFIEPERIVARLAGTESEGTILKEIIRNSNSTFIELVKSNDEILRLKTELSIVKADLDSLLRSLNQTVFSPYSNTEFQTLKNRRGIY
jgi:hypothetical protein